MTETKEQRAQRFLWVCNFIVNTSDNINFYDFIDLLQQDLQDFRLVYSTNTFNHDFNGISLSEIEHKCPPLTKYFGGTGLYFYTNDIHKKKKKIRKRNISS